MLNCIAGSLVFFLRDHMNSLKTKHSQRVDANICRTLGLLIQTETGFAIFIKFTEVLADP